MSDKIKAADAKFGEFYEYDNRRWRCVTEQEGGNNPKFILKNEYFELHPIGIFADITHLPDCTGWDWQPPKPKPDTSLAASCNRLEVWFNDEGVAEYEYGDVLTSDDAQRIIAAARKWNDRQGATKV